MNVFEKFINCIKTNSVQTLSYCLVLISVISSANAQEKESLNIKSTTIAYHITKNTKDTELEEIKKEVNNEKIANLSFSNIKRNEKGEIIQLNTKFIDQRGSSQQKSEFNSSGIADFTVKIHSDESGTKYLELGTNSNTALHTSHDPHHSRSLYSEQATDGLEDFFAQDFMQLMNSMQTDMKNQREEFLRLLNEQQQEPLKESETIEQKKKK